MPEVVVALFCYESKQLQSARALVVITVEQIGEVVMQLGQQFGSIDGVHPAEVAGRAWFAQAQLPALQTRRADTETAGQLGAAEAEGLSGLVEMVLRCHIYSSRVSRRGTQQPLSAALRSVETVGDVLYAIRSEAESIALNLRVAVSSADGFPCLRDAWNRVNEKQCSKERGH